MAYRCPRCASTDHTEELDDEGGKHRAWCDLCRLVFEPTPPPRLLDPPERRRKDTDE